MERVEQKKYKGYNINIYQDDNTESPDEWHDDGLFLVGYHRDFTVDHSRTAYDKATKEHKVIDRGIPQTLAQDIARGGKYEDGSRNDEAARYVKEYYIFGLEAYIHSGVVLALSREGNFPDRGWDVSQLGLVFVKKTETKSRGKARELALGLIKTWNDYLSGSVYGYMIERADGLGGETGGCWGFYGYDYEKSGLLASARGEINCQIKEDKKLDQIAAMAA